MNASNTNQNVPVPLTVGIQTWMTGRDYTEAGQRIAVVVLPSTGRVAFVDVDRGISGVTKNALPGYSDLPALKSFFMEEYDHGRYSGNFYDTPEIGSLEDISGFLVKMKIAAREQTKNESAILYGESTRAFDPISPDGYAMVMADPALQLDWQDRLDSFFGERIVDVRNALRDAGWEGANRSPVLTRDDMQIQFSGLHVGAGRNIVGGDWKLLATNNMNLSLNSRTITKLPDVLSGTAAELADEIDRMKIRESSRISENKRRSPHQLTFKEFAEIAVVSKLDNHGRQWAVEFGKESLGFADGPRAEDGLRQAHSNAINNAIYSNTPDAPDFMEKAVFPPQHVMAEYPELKAKFADVFEAHDLMLLTQNIGETIRCFVGEHDDWWDDQISAAADKVAKSELQTWHNDLMVIGDPATASKCLVSFVGFVEAGRLDWLESSIEDCLENVLFSEAKAIVDKALAKEASAGLPAVGDVVREGSFSGKVLDSVGGVVTQKINREGDTVQHALKSLSAPVLVGSVVDIEYCDGVGVVAGQGVSVGLGR